MPRLEWSACGKVQLNELCELATWTQTYPGLPDVMIAGTVFGSGRLNLQLALVTQPAAEPVERPVP